MPRPRVKPQDRKRSVQACSQCKASKKRCDSKQPCRTCIVRGLADSCKYATSRRQTNVAGSQNMLDSGSGLPLMLPGKSHPIVQYNNHRTVPTESNEKTEISYPRTSDGTRSTRETTPSAAQRSIMLFSSNGERVFLGSAAAVSFLRFLQAIVKRYVGPTGFTDGQNSRKMFEVEVPDISTDTFTDMLDEEEKGTLVQCFLDVSSGLLDLFTLSEISRMLKLSQDNPTPGSSSCNDIERENIACLYLMIAIGAQCRGNNEADLLCASQYFSQARRMAFEGMLQNPTLNMVRTFLLLAFYMFGACRRNAAFMYIGVAAKGSIILGLHTSEQYKNISTEERDIRRRTCKSLRVLDLVSSSILGRPGSSFSLLIDDIPGEDLGQELSHRSLALNAAYESSSVLEAIVQKLTEREALDVDSTDHFLQMWREWSEALPKRLRQRPHKGRETGFGSNNREVMIGNVHVACAYYFGVILVTRQFLVQHIIPQLRGNGKGQTFHQGSHEDHSRVIQLSSVCIDAATYMAQMCCDAAEAGVFWGNMCILKAWLFAAGLVLGFSLLAEGPISPETNDAFHGSRQLLRSFGKLSPQAAQYYQILTSLSEAIDVYREKLWRLRRETRAPYVEQILSLDPPSSTSSDQHNASEDTINDDMRAQDAEDETSMVALSDFLGTPQMSEWLAPPENEDILLRLFWDCQALNFTDYVPPNEQLQPT